MTDVKICGLSTPETLKAAIEGGARHVGFVFYPPSPRNVTLEQAAELSALTPPSVRRVGLFVDPTNKDLEKTLQHVQLDIIQLHGNEKPERVSDIKDRFQKPVMKALRIATKYDLEDLPDYEAVADWLLFDAKPQDADLPGGTGESFDWSVLKGLTFSKPWMLSGGLDEENVTEALSILKPKAVDVSSGVESERGIKDAEKIKEFIETVKTL